MKILIYSSLFYPNVGGLETIIATLAHEFVRQGHEVKLISQTPDAESKKFTFEVIRQPKSREILELTRWCDVYFQGCVSLKGLWSLFFVPRPLVISHHTWYCRSDGKLSWQDHLKKFVTRFATNISVSHEIAEALPVTSTIIPNSYQEDIFSEIPDIPRNKELVFLGRLVSDKGANLLLDALAQLKLKGLTPQLTIIGSGPDEIKLRRQVQDLELDSQVAFAGVIVGDDLAKSLNSHQIMAVPSIWKEPFGIVALEGIACGCVVVGSEGGGLKNAIGSCGITFPNGDVHALAETLQDLLQNPEKLAYYRAKAPEHLAHHQKSAIARSYIELMEKLI